MVGSAPPSTALAVPRQCLGFRPALPSICHGLLDLRPGTSGRSLLSPLSQQLRAASTQETGAGGWKRPPLPPWIEEPACACAFPCPSLPPRGALFSRAGFGVGPCPPASGLRPGQPAPCCICLSRVLPLSHGDALGSPSAEKHLVLAPHPLPAPPAPLSLPG